MKKRLNPQAKDSAIPWQAYIVINLHVLPQRNLQWFTSVTNCILEKGEYFENLNNSCHGIFFLNVAWFICSSSANGQVSLYYPRCLMLYSVLIQFLDGLFLKYGCIVRSRLLDDGNERREWIKMQRSISLIHVCHPPSASHTVRCSQEEVL